jgi:hypothetical protein
MTPLTHARLRDLCAGPLTTKSARDACLTLGGLTPWWLTDEVLDRARASADPAILALAGEAGDPRPPLSAARGACSVVSRARGDLGRLLPAVLLPLRWHPDQPHSASLPGQLRDLADLAKAQVKGSKVLSSLAADGWGLQPDPRLGLDRAPLADDVFETAASGWAAVLAGLIAALQGLEPVPAAWASAAWDGRVGLARVDGLPEKLGLAVRWGAATFAVPVWQRGEAEDWVTENAPGRLEILPLPAPAEPDPWATVKDFLSRFTAAPAPPHSADDDEGFERCRQYYLNLPAFKDQDTQFYQTHLHDAISERCRRKVARDYGHVRPTHLITIVSKSPELAVMAARAMGVTHCLLLHTPDLAAAALDCKGRLAPTVQGVPHPFTPGPNLLREIRAAVAGFTAGVPGDKVVIDLKPGTKKMTFSMGRAASPGNWLFNLETSMLQDRRNDPGSEEPDLLQA